MSYLIEYHPGGRIQQCMTGPVSTLDKAAESSPYQCLISDFSATNANHFVRDGQVLEKGDRPSESYVFDFESGAWVFDLEVAKSNKWDEIKAARTAQEFGTFDWGGYTFQCDEVSQRRIQGAVQLASMDSGFAIDWTLADNTVVTLSSQDMIEAGQALASHVNSAHMKSRQLRADIDGCVTEDDVKSITW